MVSEDQNIKDEFSNLVTISFQSRWKSLGLSTESYCINFSAWRIVWYHLS